MKLYKYQFRFLLIFSRHGKEVKKRQDYINALTETQKCNEATAVAQLSQLNKADYIDYALKDEVRAKTNFKYDGRRTYYTIGPSGFEFLECLGIESKDDEKLTTILAKELLRRNE